MSDERFATSLRAEIEALVGRYEEVARAFREPAESRIRALEAALAEKAARLAEVEAELERVRGQKSALDDAFSAEKAFVDAALGVAASELGDALGRAAGPLDRSAATYARLKDRKLDAVLASALRDRGRQIAMRPVSPEEKAALTALATAARCELVEPAVGTKFSPSSMEKAQTAPDPAEEGNVLACLLPGLRLAGETGQLVFPSVKVAT